MPELPACERATPGARGLVIDAERLLAEGEPLAARSCLERVITEEPHYFRAMRAYQDALLAIPGGIDALEFALTRLADRDDAAAHVLVARVLEDEEAADRHLDAALQNDPTFHWALLGKAVLAARHSRFDQAEELLSNALGHYAEFDAALLARAQVRDQLADFEGAADDYRRYLDVRGGDTTALYNLATIMHRELDRPDQAEELYRVLLDIDDGMSEAVVGLAVCLTEQHRYEEAGRLYESVRDQEPSALFNLGMLYQEHLDDPAKARRCFQEFIEWDGPRAENQSAADRLIYAPVRLSELDRESGSKGSKRRARR